MSDVLQISLVMVTAIIFLLMIGVPISVSIGFGSVLALLFVLPFKNAMTTSAQKIFGGMGSFSLLAIPFFILAGNIMNQGGIALRLLNCAKVLSGRIPGPLAQANVVGNMLFGAISGSGVAAAAAMGGTIGPIQEKEGYDKAYYSAVNIASAPTGMLIPPSNTLIVYSTVAGSVSVSALFLAGYLPGILWGLGVMIIAAIGAKKRGYVNFEKTSLATKLKTILEAVPSLLLIIIVIGGILKGVFTATEGSAIAVVYALFLSALYRTISFKDLPKILLDSAEMSAIVIFMIGVSSIMSWVMSYTNIPALIANALLSATQNKIVIFLLINLILLIVGMFMDPTPAILIFTPIFLPVCTSLGMHPVHFGIMITFNLCIGTITPPVGPILFTGCKVAQIRIEEVIRELLPYFFITVLCLILVTFVPTISLLIPKAFGLIL